MVGLAINEKIISDTHAARQSVIQYGGNGIHTFNDLFGNFSRMSVVLNSTSPNGWKDSLNATFMVLGIATVDRESTYEVNITGDETTNGQSMDESLVAWISMSSGQVVQTHDEEDGTLQGAKAEQEDNVLSMFTTMPWLSLLNSSAVSVVSGSEQRMTIG